MIPEAIEYLIHLRYLMLDQVNPIKLPKSLSKLYHLQFIIYDPNLQSLHHDFLPRDMNNFFNLHYLKLPWDYFSGIHGIGKLNSLQRLDGFYVKNEAGYRIGELEHMNELHQLRIKLLENVKDAKEACSAKLCAKRNLMDLSLEWGDIHVCGLEPKMYYFSKDLRNTGDPNLDEIVLDNLQPHNKLKKLRINAYMGVKSAICMNRSYLISNLEYIQLDKCLEWQILPPFGQLPFLKSLYLHNMPKVKRLDNKFDGNGKDCVFPSLEVLHIKKLEALKDWFDAAADECLFPCLTELCLKDCPNLRELASLPPNLKKLKIDNIGWKTLNWKQDASNCCNISKSILLETLKVLRCSNITSLSLVDEIALKNLTIINCHNLISLRRLQEVEGTENCQLRLSKLVISGPSMLQMVPLRCINSIQKLYNKDNDELVSFPVDAEQWFMQVSSSLGELSFKRLKSLQSLPSSLPNLSSLKVLSVRKVPQLQVLPSILNSLEKLNLYFLESLQFLPSSLSISFVKYLKLISIPLQNIPDLPISLCVLHLHLLENLSCLPSCLPRLTSRQELLIDTVPQLRELPNLPPSLEELSIYRCHPELKERCRRTVGWHKIAHIPRIRISSYFFAIFITPIVPSNQAI